MQGIRDARGPTDFVRGPTDFNARSSPSHEGATPPPAVSDVLGSLARTLHQLSSATGLSREVELLRYDGSYEAQSFFDNYDAQADLAQLQYTERLRRLPNLLQESLTDGLPVADQRIVAAVQPNTLQEWYRVVSRVRGTHSASQVCQQTTRTTPNLSFALSPRYCGAMHWHAQCPKRPAQSRPRPVYRATTYPQHERTVLSSPAPFRVNNTRAHVTRSPDPLYTTSPAQAVNPSCPMGTSTTAPKQACSDAQDSTTTLLRATEESPDEESEEEDTLRRNPRRSCNAKFNRGRLESRNGRIFSSFIFITMDRKKVCKKSSAKKKIMSIELKREIIEKHDQGVRVVDLSRQYGRSTPMICSVLKRKESIKSVTPAKGLSIISKLRTSLHENMEKLLMVWVTEKQLQGDTLTQTIICEKARAIYGDLLKQTLAKLQVMWRSNPKAWVTRKFFVEWVNLVFGPTVKKYLQENNLPVQALLILDNAPAHPPNLEDDILEELKFIKVLYLPPNTTHILQPMDQQVISNFKKLYTKHLFRRCFEVT
ncbi:hypothetical protein LAZ67_15001851 [Cordylochernes scorpioides]|uniref:DDE-1 domain-containing protein n=1 Tax=Cordylochernes scorpioides TaxID=51811 RepID=A0ABY6L932_9ARAC|nr:hypothetical protein LAZ67_15001851 [Cordylochernes scorpioides]